MTLAYRKNFSLQSIYTIANIVILLKYALADYANMIRLWG